MSSVFDRLNDPSTYTGVYRERFRDGPGINHDADHRHGAPHFEGHTNARTDERIRDISQITRTNLNRSTSQGPSRRAAAKGRQKFQRAQRRAQLGLSGTGAGGRPRPQFPMDTNAQLQLIFQYYCKFGRTGGHGETQDTMDNSNFAKLSRECPGLLDDRLDPTEIDLIFTKCKQKGRRRITYAQFLDAIAAMAAVKFRSDDPATAFSKLLAHYIFNCPAAFGLDEAAAQAEAEAAEEARVEEERAARAAEAAEREKVRRKMEAAEAQRRAAMAAAYASGTYTGPLRRDPYAASGRGLEGEVDPAAFDHAAGGEEDELPPAEPEFDQWHGQLGGRQREPARRPAYQQEPLLSPDTNAKRQYAHAHRARQPVRADQAEEYPYDDTAPAVGGGGGSYGGGATYGVSGGGGRGGAGGGGGSYLRGPPQRQAVPGDDYADEGEAEYAGGAVDLDRAAGVTRAGSFSRRMGPASGRDSFRIQQAQSRAAIAAAAASRPSTAGSGAGKAGSGRQQRRSTLGSRRFVPTLPGEANKPGSVYDRLSSPANYTGVYRRAYLSDGRINAFTEPGVSAKPTRYAGSTKSKTDATIHSISVMLRPNLKSGRSFR